MGYDTDYIKELRGRIKELEAKVELLEKKNKELVSKEFKKARDCEHDLGDYYD